MNYVCLAAIIVNRYHFYYGVSCVFVGQFLTIIVNLTPHRTNQENRHCSLTDIKYKMKEIE